jgi:hypothetical protein
MNIKPGSDENLRLFGLHGCAFTGGAAVRHLKRQPAVFQISTASRPARLQANVGWFGRK